MSSHLEGLNRQQLEAVTYRGGPLLVLAGAGSGKTRVITRRIASLILDDGVPGDGILAVTFTNKAAGEMRTRVHADTGIFSRWISTFHSACVRILREHGAVLGLRRSFSIFDSDDQKKIARQAIVAANLDPTTFGPPDLLAVIRKAKTAGLMPEAYVQTISGWRQESLAAAYFAYQNLMEQAGALDFDDLLLRAVELLEREPGIRAQLQDRFQHVLVDEFQDTNAVQYRLLQLLTGANRDCTVTGDPDQSIYSWRGADLSNILSFSTDFPGAVTIRLEQNYRSTPTILRAADAVIANNFERLEKCMWTENADGPLLEMHFYPDERTEAMRIAARIEKLVAEDELDHSDFAVFFRTNAQSRAFEEAFASRGIPHVVVGAFPFYERAEVKDLLAYLRVLVNGNDHIAFDRAACTPRRGLGPKALALIHQCALARHDGDMRRAIADPDCKQSLRGAARAGVEDLDRLFTTLESLPAAPTATFIEVILEETGLLAALDAADEVERALHISELISAMSEFDRQEKGGDIAGFLEGTALASLTEENHGAELAPGAGRVSLMTIHAAKGLEFDTVFVTGLEEGLFPLMRMDSFSDDLEEERRLFYVALTRARRRLLLSSCAQRMRRGQREVQSPSSFTREIPAEVFASRIERESRARADPFDFGLDQGARGSSNLGDHRVEYDSEYQEESELGDLQAGDLVEHPKFGRGEVIEVRRGLSAKVVVSFHDLGERVVDLRYGNLSRED